MMFFLALRNMVLRPPRKPFANLRSRLRRRRALKPLFTLAMIFSSCVFCTHNELRRTRHTAPLHPRPFGDAKTQQTLGLVTSQRPVSHVSRTPLEIRQGTAHRFDVALGNKSAGAQPTLLLRAFFRQNVTMVGTPAPDLTRASRLEPLRGSPPRLHLGHADSPLLVRDCQQRLDTSLTNERPTPSSDNMGL